MARPPLIRRNSTLLILAAAAGAAGADIQRRDNLVLAGREYLHRIIYHFFTNNFQIPIICHENCHVLFNNSPKKAGSNKPEDTSALSLKVANPDSSNSVWSGWIGGGNILIFKSCF